MRALLAALVLLALSGVPAAAQPAIARTPQVTAELAPATAGVAPGGVLHLALKQTIKPGWHTYWRNPGDSGEPTRIRWTLPPGWTAEPLVWPAPRRYPIGPLVNYGYSEEAWLVTPIRAPVDARPGETVTLRADAAWLVCEEVCIPEQASLSLRVPVTAGAPPADREHGRAIRRVLDAAPAPAGLQAAVERRGEGFTLAVAGPALRGTDAREAYFFPHDGALIDHALPQAVERGPEGLTLTLPPSPSLAPGPLAGPVEGVLSVDGRAYQITAPVGPPPAGAAGLGPPVGAGRSAGGLGLPLAAGLALLGGLILNLMPCVFPVLSMKAAALAGHAHEPRAARTQGLAFLAGVLATFALLAGALLAARAAGEAVGWGFQLQSPGVVAALALVLFTVGLNLSGVFEVGGSVQNAGSGLASRGGAAGAFFTGALAVVVAAPCTAPFMAGAVGFAVTQPPAAALLVFLALGLGLALPFVALSFSPGLLRRLPRPGPWMTTLRRALAFPMYAAAAWLAWVLSRQAGTEALGLLLTAALLTAFAAWLWGQGARLPVRAGAAVSAALAVTALAGVGWRAARPTEAVAASSAEAWSPERVAALQAEGRPVFVNFTADWCVTCKVNERIALSSRRVAEAFAETGVVYLEADWTARDDAIAAELARHGRSGVPLYLLYRPGETAPAVLPQLLTEGAVARALQGAAAPRTQAALTPPAQP